MLLCVPVYTVRLQLRYEISNAFKFYSIQQYIFNFCIAFFSLNKIV
jgi:hypothetical protein